MVKSLITLVLSTLRWTHWLVQYAVVYPLGMMMLLVVVVFWTGHNTPGQMLVKTIESVQREGYVIHDCTGPASREALNGVSLDIENYCTLRLFFDLPNLAGLSRRNLPADGIRLLFHI